MLEQKFYTVADVARVTGLTSRTIRNYLKAGELHGVKVGVQWRFTEDDVIHLFQETDGREDLSTLGGNRVSEFLERDLDIESDEPGGISKSCVILDICEPDSEAREDKKNLFREKIEKCKNEIGFSYEEKEDSCLRVVLTGGYADITRLVKEMKL